MGIFLKIFRKFLEIFFTLFFIFLNYMMIEHGLVLKMLLVLHKFVLVHRPRSATHGAISAFITSHVVFLGAPQP